MDRARRRPGFLIAAAGAALAALALAAAAPPRPAPPLRAMRWLAPGADIAQALGSKPVECLHEPGEAEGAYSVELGRAAFRTPLLLGGVAARAGVSCETCHANGRTNPSFDFPGVSGAPGTADVTSSLFSSHRGDGVDNPKPIPDLGGPARLLKVSRDPASGALETFVRGLVTQEFDGGEPPPAVLKGLADYVRAISPSACPAPVREAVTLERALADARRAARAALAALDHRDGPAAVVMVQAARSGVGAIHERFAAPDLADPRQRLVQADLDLRAAEDAARAGDLPGAQTRLTAWLSGLPRLEAALRSVKSRSLYDRGVLAAAGDVR